MRPRSRAFLLLFLFAAVFHAQVYSPKVLRKGQVDTTDLTAFVQGIYNHADAVTERQKAEAIWRFFLTDGRFVKPGFWYHIAGWAYEETMGEVLDPMKLLNSYGFGLCYQIAPLLEAVFEAGGFPDARVWFLTGHTVTEVFYDGAYHYYDSDMLGYNPIGQGDPRKLPVAGVRDIEKDGNVILGKLKSPKEVDKSLVDSPWYPADLREAAMSGLTELFTTTNNNWLYPYARFPRGHAMDFVLRHGERMIRNFVPEQERPYYLPYKFVAGQWLEFPQEVKRYQIHTEDGPHSQRDNRRWATGQIQYRPVLSEGNAYYPAFNENLQLPAVAQAGGYLTPKVPGAPAQAVFEMPCPYVIIDADVSLKASLKTPSHSLVVETSTDGGLTWEAAGAVKGPHEGAWQTTAPVKGTSEHGKRTAVSGTYGYLVRLTLAGPGPVNAVTVSDVSMATHFQLNPRSLPEVTAGLNEFVYHPGAARRRWTLPVAASQVEKFASKVLNARYLDEGGQGFVMPQGGGKGAEVVFELTAPDGSALSGFDAGGRFLEIRDGTAPDKLTAETRRTTIQATRGNSAPKASLAWATKPAGPYAALWKYQPPEWKDGQAIERTLLWPEVDRQVRALPSGTKKVYVRYQFDGMAMDDFRLAAIAPQQGHEGTVEITHLWREGGAERKHVERVLKPGSEHRYGVETATGAAIANEALIVECR